MTDFDDLERKLGRYRPSGPPSDLRARALETAPASQGGRRLLRWLPAAAALAIAAVLYGLASQQYGRVATEVTNSTEAARTARIEQLTSFLGGDDDARQMAVRLIADDERRAARAPASPASGESR